MTIQTTCQHCGKFVSLEASDLDPSKCPKCGQVTEILKTHDKIVPVEFDRPPVKKMEPWERNLITAILLLFAVELLTLIFYVLPLLRKA